MILRRPRLRPTAFTGWTVLPTQIKLIKLDVD